MLFNSIEFLLFAILFFVLWSFFNRKNQSRWLFLTLSSFLFYAWWDWRFLFLIIGSGLIDFFSGLAIEKKPTQKKIYLLLSLIGNLGGLAFFKYSLFFATIIDDLLGSQLAQNIPEFALILPVGISFYTFQSMSYTIDVYRGTLKPTRNLLHFFSYLAMFPQLVAGPIIRASDMLHQLGKRSIVNNLQRWHGVKLIAFGLFQKVVIADNISGFVDAAFDGRAFYEGALFWWMVVVAFAFQIYCDFSGYSLIAKGLAKCMGYHFKSNFNHPYLSKSLREFWTRWHISLSNWFRDYVYIPLGGNQKGVAKGILFLWITMLLSGLWHGAQYTFLIWAAIHALMLSIERLTNWNKGFKFKGSTIILILLTFMQVCIAWVYFRATSWQQANEIVMQLFSFEGSSLKFWDEYYDHIVFLELAIVIELVILLRRTYLGLYTFYRRYNLDFWLVAMALVMAVFFRGDGQQFIYFQF